MIIFRGILLTNNISIFTNLLHYFLLINVGTSYGASPVHSDKPYQLDLNNASAVKSSNGVYISMYKYVD